MWKNCIEVYYSDAWREIKIATIPRPIKYRKRIEALIDSLNRKYLGHGNFYAVEISYWKQPCGASGSVFGFDKRMIAGEREEYYL